MPAADAVPVPIQGPRLVPAQPQPLSLVHFDPRQDAAVETPLALHDPGATLGLKMECCPGADAVVLTFTDGAGQPQACFEVAARGGELLSVEVGRTPQGELRLEAGGRPVFQLPVSSAAIRACPRVPRREAAALDLLLLVDATALFWPEPSASDSKPKKPDDRLSEARLLLKERAAWNRVVEALLELVKLVTAPFPDLHLAVLAFADQPCAALQSDDLRPEFDLFPPAERRRLEAMDLRALGLLLTNLVGSSGGDFVDALGDALGAASEQYHWRPEARHLLLLCGDSPGHSLVHGAPVGADLRVRRQDVDQAAIRLHYEHGVELATLFLDWPQALRDSTLVTSLHLFAEAQYRRLASWPGLAFTGSRFDPKAAAEAWLHPPVVLGRGPTLGLLRAIERPGA